MLGATSASKRILHYQMQLQSDDYGDPRVTISLTYFNQVNMSIQSNINTEQKN